jgi:endonuclease/exonuclease/phosphatase (EEP) superfamily protein YafD
MKAPSVSGLLQVIAVLPAAGFVLGLFGRFHWTLDLFSHFRAQYAAALLGCAIGFFVLRQRKSALVSFLAGLLISTTILFSSQSLPPAGKAIPLKVISFNVNTSNTRQEEILQFLQAEDADVLFLMEVNDAWMTALHPLDAGYPYRLTAPREDNFGVAFYSKVPFRGEVKESGLFGVPWTDVVLENSGVRLVAIHPLPPSGEENSRWRNEQLFEIAAMLRGKPRTVLCGDLNLTPYSPWFPELLKKSGLRSTAPPCSPTWMRHYPLFAIPIDHVLLSPDLTLASRKVGPSLGSDHSALVVEIAEASRLSP